MLPSCVTYQPGFLAEERARLLHAILAATVPWQQREVRVFGRSVPQPRLTAWYGDAGASYSYSGVRNDPLAWTPELADLCDYVAMATGATYNSVLLNCYRDGGDSVAWHSDDERELGVDPTIASISLGAPRLFQLRRRDRSADAVVRTVALGHGSLLAMSGECQREWQHRVPKTTALVGERINLTFRRIS